MTINDEKNFFTTTQGKHRPLVSVIQQTLTNEKHLFTALSGPDGEKAFDALFRTWYEPLVRYAHSFTEGDVDEAEELVQEAFVKLWSQRENLDFQHSAKAYLYRMVHNMALNRLRSIRTHEKFAQYEVRRMENETGQPESTELQHRLRKVLDLLPAQCRQVFELSRFEELKYKEIAAQLNISIKTVETHMGKALKILRQELAEYLSVLLALVHFFHF